MKRVQGNPRQAVVVGAGLGGLSAAMHLRGAGVDVTVIERETVPGGRAGVATIDGYRFDTGPTVVTMPEILAEPFAALGEDINDWISLTRLDPAYRAFYPDGSTLDVTSDVDAMADRIAGQISATDAQGYLRYVQHVEGLYRTQIDAFIDRNFDSVRDLIGTPLAQLVAMRGFTKLQTDVNRYFTDERLRRLFSFQSMYAGLAPQQALALYGVISYMDCVSGVYYPQGGVHELPSSMAAAAEKSGVKIHYDTTAVKVERNGDVATAVNTANGESIPADVVIINVDAPDACRNLLGIEPRKLRKATYSPSCAVLLAGSTASYSQLAHHNIHFGRAWKTTFDDLMKHGQQMHDPSFFVCNPSVSDSSVARPGTHSYYALFPTPNTRTAVNADWSDYRDVMVQTMQKHGYRGLDESIEVERVITPTEWAEMGLENGTPFSASHSLRQTGPFRFPNLMGRNIVFAGSATTPGVGIPMVIISGKLAAQRVTG